MRKVFREFRYHTGRFFAAASFVVFILGVSLIAGVLIWSCIDSFNGRSDDLRDHVLPMLLEKK